MTDRGSHQGGKVSFKSLDSESMAAARAAAQAAGLTLEEWLSRTILKNAAKLGIEPGGTRAAPDDALHGTDEEAREDAQRSLEAITRHLEEAQEAADAAGVSVAEWLSRAIIRSTQDGHEAMTRYVQQRAAEETENIGRLGLPQAEPDTDAEIGAEQDEPAERQDWFEEPDERHREPEPAGPETSRAAEAEDAWGMRGVPDFGMPEPPPEEPDHYEPAAREAQDEGAEASENEMRAAEIVTRRRQEHEASPPFGLDQTWSAPGDDTLELTTPATDRPQGRRESLLADEEGEPKRRRRWLSWFWSTLLILLAMLAAAIWILPNMDELGLSDVLGIEESEMAAEPDRQASDGGEAAGDQEAAGGDGSARTADAGQAEQGAADESRPESSGADEEPLAELEPDRFPRPAEDNVAWYREAAGAGNPHAQYTLATLFLQGKGVERDFERAAALFRQAADDGNLARAQYALGVLYERGLGVEENALEALIMYQKAADQGYVLALTKVGEAYLHGRGIGQDYAQAQRYFERAAESGEANAQYGLGRMYELGLGVETDMVQALKWFTLAAERDHAEAAGRVEAIVPEMTQEQRDRAADLVVEHNRRFGERERQGSAR